MGPAIWITMIGDLPESARPNRHEAGYGARESPLGQPTRRHVLC